MQIADIANDLQVSLAGLDPARIAEGELEGLRHLAFAEFRPQVTIHYADTHKKVRDDAGASHFEPDKCEVVIRFVPAVEGEQGQQASAKRPAAARAGYGPSVSARRGYEASSTPARGYDQGRDRHRPHGFVRADGYSKTPAPPPMRMAPFDREEAMTEMLDALQRAEGERRFVGIKWFRDRYLPEQEFSWSNDPRTCGTLLRMGTEGQLVLTHQVTNPRNPEHPVTAIRLNRDHPRFRGDDQPSPQPRFKPVKIRGDGLSSTVVGQRR